MKNCKNMPAISIICPVYKAEKYIHKCVDSVLAQTFTDFELLLIDDGSPDDSGRICDEYAEKDFRIRVFHKKNGGVASARQMGLDNASGEYTIHVDPDDWVEPNMLEELYAKAKETDADMVICDFYTEYSTQSNYISQEPSKLDSESILRSILLGELHGALWNKLIRKDCYSIYNISFHPNIYLWEDRYVCCNLLLNNLRVEYLSKAFYHYDNYSNDLSIVRTNHEKGIESQKKFIAHFEEKLDRDSYAEELYKIKAEVKDKAFVCRSFSKNDFISLYSEINQQYKNDRPNFRCHRSYASLVYIFNSKTIPY